MINKIIKLVVIGILGLSVQGCQKEPGPEESCFFVQNSKSRRVSWENFPIPLYADKHIDDLGYKALVEGARVWNQQFNRIVFEVRGRTEGFEPLAKKVKPTADGYNSIYFIANGSGFEKGEQATTFLHSRGDAILEADIVINGSNNFYIGNDSLEAKKKAEIEYVSLMVHELGHVLGLDDIYDQEKDSVMVSQLEFGKSRRIIKDSDRESLSCEY